MKKTSALAAHERLLGATAPERIHTHLAAQKPRRSTLWDEVTRARAGRRVKVNRRNGWRTAI